MNNPKGQHFLPSVYLKCFCDVSGRLHLYDFVKKEFRSNIKPDSIAKKRHLYTVTNNGAEDYRIEEYFGKLETNYAKHVREITDGRIAQLTENDLLEIIWFVSLLYARNLSMVNRLSEMSQDALSFMGNGFLNLHLQQAGKEHLHSLLQIKPTENSVQTASMSGMYVTAQTLFKLLTNKGEWIFFVSGGASEFITTDNPMSNLVLLPLSKKVLFARVTEQIEGLRRTMIAPPDWVHNMNRTIASSATRYLFASRKPVIQQEYLNCKNEKGHETHY